MRKLIMLMLLMSIFVSLTGCMGMWHPM